MGCNNSGHAEPDPKKKTELPPKPITKPVVDEEEANKEEENTGTTNPIKDAISGEVASLVTGSMKKILVMGSDQTGKQSFINRYVTGTMESSGKELAFQTKNVVHNDTEYKIRLFKILESRASNTTHLSSAAVVVFLYSLDNENTFNDLQIQLELLSLSLPETT